MRQPRFAEALLAWFDEHGRTDLPWQQEPDPYRIWVSEIMLQQTRVATVIPYYRRFIERFPDLPSLAEAPQEQVLAYWSGLGYYARARNLHRAAQQVRDLYAGRFPHRVEQVRALPGVGLSTAGAVLSLAFGQRQPILDGNVKRVLTRCFAIAGWPGEAGVAKRLWGLAEELTPQQRVASYNQAMMDLGATLCIRTRPACNTCPLRLRCVAHAAGRETAYPSPRPRRALPVHRTRMLLIRCAEGRILLEKRPPAGVWGGLWSLPECPPDVLPEHWSEEKLGLRVRELENWTSRRHTFSHFHLDIDPRALVVESNPSFVGDDPSYGWFPLTQVRTLALAAPVAQLLDELRTKAKGETDESPSPLRATES